MFGLWDSLKNKSEQLIDIYARDIKEFAQTISHDAKPIAELILPVLPQDEMPSSSDDANNSKSAATSTITTVQFREIDAKTYTDAITPEEEEQAQITFDKWKQENDVNSKVEEITSILNNNEQLKQLQAELVPVTVSFELFWQRYFYRRDLFKKNEEQRKKLESRT